MKVIPLHDRVLLRRTEEQEVKKCGIIIPDTAKDRSQEAEVIVVGKGRISEGGRVIPLTVKKENVKKMGQDMEFNGLK